MALPNFRKFFSIPFSHNFGCFILKSLDVPSKVLQGSNSTPKTQNLCEKRNCFWMLIFLALPKQTSIGYKNQSVTLLSSYQHEFNFAHNLQQPLKNNVTYFKRAYIRRSRSAKFHVALCWLTLTDLKSYLFIVSFCLKMHERRGPLLKLLFLFCFLMLLLVTSNYHQVFTERIQQSNSTQTLSPNSTSFAAENFKADYDLSIEDGFQEPEISSELESNPLLKLVAKTVLRGCSKLGNNDFRLKLDPLDCALFCLGRAYSFVNFNNQSTPTCFCSHLKPAFQKTDSSICGQKDTFWSYQLKPIMFPTIQVS